MKYEQLYFWHVNKLRHNLDKGQQASACEQQWHGNVAQTPDLGIIVIIIKCMHRPCLIFLLVWSGHSKTSPVFSEDINYRLVGDV